MSETLNAPSPSECIYNSATQPTILVLSGGGVKLIAHAGAVAALDECHMLDTITTYSGTSAGGIVSYLLAIGYSSSQITTIVSKLDLKHITNYTLDNLLTDYGLDNGSRMELVLEQLEAYALSRLGVQRTTSRITFAELHDATQKTLILTGTCLNTHSVQYFSHQHTPDLAVITAVRVTTCVPIVFAPVCIDSKLYVDGGCMENLPINLFRDDLDHVIGVYLRSDKDTARTISNMEDFIANILLCYSEAMIAKDTHDVSDHIAVISVPFVFGVDFGIDDSTKHVFYDAGYAQMKSFIENISHDGLQGTDRCIADSPTTGSTDGIDTGPITDARADGCT